MKRIIIASIVAVALTTGFAAKAAEKGKGKMEEVRKELIEKYDTNKDGKIDKDEAEKMAPEDKAKWDRLSGGKKKKKSE
ncbi:MAG: hypothetical protein HY301_13560 [Verrucomicrobia bacterium]|nr:hypothetical protein [Verrucomicrobiota bacterium]